MKRLFYISIFFGIATLFLTTSLTSLAQNSDNNPPSLPGQVSGTGTFFEITDSDYLNVSLESTESIDAFFSSVPKVVSIVIQPSTVSSGQPGTHTIKDPMWYETKRLDQPANIASHIQDYDNHFDTANLFSRLVVPRRISAALNLYLSSPAELLIIDPGGKKLGTDPISGMTHNEILDGIYTREGPIVSSETPLDINAIRKAKALSIPSPANGAYQIQIIGTDSGDYALDVLVYDQNGDSKSTTYNGKIRSAVVQEYELNFSTENVEQTQLSKVVEIDIKPGSDPNSINLKSKGTIPVAILSDEFFNAKDVVIGSVVFAGASSKKGKLEDVDSDGDLDLMIHFDTRSLQLTPVSTESTLIGRLTDDTQIKGVSFIRIVTNFQSESGIFFALLNMSDNLPRQFKVIFHELAATWKKIWAFLNDRFDQTEEKPEEIGRGLCLEDNKRADLKIDKRDRAPSNAIVSIIDRDNDSLLREFQISDIIPNHYHPYEIHQCGVYIIREFNYDYQKGKTLPGFRMEAWRYKYDGSSQKLTDEGDFRVDPTETLITFKKEYWGSDGYALVIRNLNTLEDVFVLPISDITKKSRNILGSIGLNEWTRNGRYFWFDLSMGANVFGFIRVDVSNWSYQAFGTPTDVLGGDALNVEKSLVTWHPGNKWIGIEERFQQEVVRLRAQGINTELYIINLSTGEKIKVTETNEPLWYFRPQWISDTELQYEMPDGEKKIYTVR